MPYPTNADLPPDVRARYSERCQTVWREAWTATMAAHHDEGRAFATANAAANQCKESTKMDTPLAVKFVEGTDNLIEGLAIPFGGPIAGKDRHGEAFSADTDLALDWFPEEGRPTLYQHGLDETIKTALVGRQVERELRDEGHWVKVQLDKRNRHMTSLAKLIDEQALSFSSGATPHLVVAGKDGTITRWPWVELSLTPTPANDYAAAYAVKTAEAIEHIAAARVTIPQALKDALDEWPGTEPDLAEKIEAVSAEIRHLTEQASHHAEVRAKAGRVLSAATRSRLAHALEMAEPLVEDIRELLAASDPATNKKAVEAEYVRFQESLARAAGMQ